MKPTDEDIFFMKLAMEEASFAFKEGEVPVGAVIVKDGDILSRAHNLREKINDPSAHAEMLVLRAAAQLLGSWRLTGTTLYVTKEPCIMCSGAVVNARISRLVFGCRDEKAGGVESLYSIPSDPRLNHRVDVLQGVLEDECADILRRFFQARR